MSVLGLKLEYTVKYGLSPRHFLRAQPSGNTSGLGHILLSIPTHEYSIAFGKPVNNNTMCALTS